MARVRDLESHNGTRLNGMQIGRPANWHLPAELTAEPCRTYDLRDGDLLRICNNVFAVRLVAGACPRGQDSNYELALCV